MNIYFSSVSCKFLDKWGTIIVKTLTPVEYGIQVINEIAKKQRIAKMGQFITLVFLGRIMFHTIQLTPGGLEQRCIDNNRMEIVKNKCNFLRQLGDEMTFRQINYPNLCFHICLRTTFELTSGITSHEAGRTPCISLSTTLNSGIRVVTCGYVRQLLYQLWVRCYRQNRDYTLLIDRSVSRLIT